MLAEYLGIQVGSAVVLGNQGLNAEVVSRYPVTGDFVMHCGLVVGIGYRDVPLPVAFLGNGIVVYLSAKAFLAYRFCQLDRSLYLRQLDGMIINKPCLVIFDIERTLRRIFLPLRKTELLRVLIFGLSLTLFLHFNIFIYGFVD